MASPFSIFRKHQRVMLAAVTILAMVGFVFMGPFTRSGNGPGSGAKGAEVATWKFGAIYNSDLSNLRGQRNILNAFFAQAIKEVEAKGKMPEGAYPPRYPVDDNSLVQAIVLHKKAEQMGVVVNDQAVNERIEAETRSSLSGDEKAQIAAGIHTGENTHLTARQLVEALRYEMELQAINALLGSDIYEISTPEQRWDYFSRLNRRATVEVLPVAVKDFVGKVKATPSEAELKSFFEMYKNYFSSPDSPTPGFKEPERAKFQYFVANDDNLVKEEKPKVTDDEIKQYYEKHKEEFKKSDDEGAVAPDKSKSTDTKTPDSKTSPDAGKAGDKSEKPSKDDKQPAETKSSDLKSSDSKSDGKSSEAKPADAKPADTKPSDAKPTNTKATDVKSPDAKSSDLKSSDLKSSDSKSSDAMPADAKPTDSKSSPAKTPSPGKSSLLDRRSGRVIREELLALADDAAAKSPGAPAADKSAAPTTAAKDAASKDEAAKKDDLAKKDQAAPPTDKTPVDKAAPAPAGTQKTPSEKSTPPSAEPDKAQPPKTPTTKEGLPDLGLKPTEPPKKIPIVEYRSLTDETVRDEIRASIAKQKVRDRVEAAFKDLQTKISTYKRKFDNWNGKKVGDAPPPPDFMELAKQNHLKFEETGLITPLDAQELLLGKSYSFAPDSLARINFMQTAFSPTLGNYRPESTGTNQFDWLFDLKPEPTETANFLWWRVDYKDAYVPEFDKVKIQVLEVWKMVEARKLAKAQAKEYADEANKKKARLDEAFAAAPNVHVSTVGPFTWMSAPAVALDPTQPSPPPRVSEVTGVDKAGEEFMRTVFRLEPGSSGFAMNQPETIAYVIQAISFAPSEQDFHRQFLSEMAVAGQKGYRTLGATVLDSERARLAKFQAIFKEFDFKPVAQSATNSVASSGAPSAPADEGDE